MSFSVEKRVTSLDSLGRTNGGRGMSGRVLKNGEYLQPPQL